MTLVKTIQHIKIVNALYGNPGINITEIAGRSKTSTVTVTTFLQKLKSKKFVREVRRKPANVNYERAISKHYCLTIEGLKAINDLQSDIRLGYLSITKVDPWVNDLELTQRTKNLIFKVLDAEAVTLSDTLLFTKQEWLSVEGFGTVCMKELESYLNEYCLKLRSQ